MERLTFDFVKDFIEQNSDCILLSEEYFNYSTPLKLKCKCGVEFITDFGHFKTQKKRQCGVCGRKIRDDKDRLGYDYVKKYIEDNTESILMSTEYVNNSTKLQLRCSCGSIFEASFAKIKDRNKVRCTKCSKKIVGKEYSFSYEEVEEYVVSKGCSLLSEQYINNTTPLIIQCSCGDIYTTTFQKFKDRDKVQCTKCGISNRAEFWRLDFNEVSKIISNQRCELLETEYINAKTYMKIKCSCGDEYSTTFDQFTKGRIRCKKCSNYISSGEYKVINFLNENDIFFIFQYTFEDLKRLSFDFAIIKDHKLKLLIEVDGEQHFKPVDRFGGEVSFIKQRERDALKNKYCNDRNIKLLRIPYTEFNNIPNILSQHLC